MRRFPLILPSRADSIFGRDRVIVGLAGFAGLASGLAQSLCHKEGCSIPRPPRANTRIHAAAGVPLERRNLTPSLGRREAFPWSAGTPLSVQRWMLDAMDQSESFCPKLPVRPRHRGCRPSNRQNQTQLIVVS